jgi:hypothetical protein
LLLLLLIAEAAPNKNEAGVVERERCERASKKEDEEDLASPKPSSPFSSLAAAAASGEG